MRKIITIAREYGAGGRSVGRAVAQRLGIGFYDRDLVIKTAEATNLLSAEEIRKWDENVPHDVGLTQSLFNFYNRPLSDKIWEAQVTAIRSLAEHESCVLVGRNADYILREFDHVLRVFIYADWDWRAMHMKELEPEKTISEIESDMHRIDRRRHKYCETYTGQTYGLMSNFDLSINTGKLGIDAAVELILQAAENI